VATEWREKVITPEREIEAIAQSLSAGKKIANEEVAKLADAKIAILDYELLRRDFPILKSLTEAKIDRWVLDQVGYISLPQTQQTMVNSQIPIVDGVTREAFRPPDYNRAHVYEVSAPDNPSQPIGLIDVKGSGALAPAQESHGNGVGSLGEMIREYLFENLVREVLHDANLENKTVGSYGVISTGFNVIHADGTTSPAGIYLRQAHIRSPQPGSWLPLSDRHVLEVLFNKYGIDPESNIQGTSVSDIIDFGHYSVNEDLSKIDEKKQVPFELWGHDRNIINIDYASWFFSKQDYPWIWSHQLAEDFASGKANREHVLQHMENLLGPVRKKLNLTPKLEKNCLNIAKQFN